jgi:hypothetical protein
VAQGVTTLFDFLRFFAMLPRILRTTERDMRLPESVQEIADVIGEDKALELIGKLPACGRRSWRVVLYVPKRLKPDHKLVQLIGWLHAEKLVRHFGGEILQPSNCRCLVRAKRNDRIRDLSANDNTPQQIADQVGLSERQIRNILGGEKAPE